MWFFIIFIVCAFLLFFFAIRADNRRKENVSWNKPRSVSRQLLARINNTQTKPTLQIEFSRRKQILEESISLIQETGNIETLLSRYDIALEHYHWIMEQKAKGLPIYFDTEEEGFESALNRIRNYHIVRIAMEKFINYKKKMHELKTSKAKGNNTSQMFEFLEKCKQSLNPHINKNESESKLDRLHHNTEDFYSDNA